MSFGCCETWDLLGDYFGTWLLMVVHFGVYVWCGYYFVLVLWFGYLLFVLFDLVCLISRVVDWYFSFVFSDVFFVGCLDWFGFCVLFWLVVVFVSVVVLFWVSFGVGVVRAFGLLFWQVGVVHLFCLNLRVDDVDDFWLGLLGTLVFSCLFVLNISCCWFSLEWVLLCVRLDLVVVLRYVWWFIIGVFAHLNFALLFMCEIGG